MTDSSPVKGLPTDDFVKLRVGVGDLLNSYCRDCRALTSVGEACDAHRWIFDSLNRLEDGPVCEPGSEPPRCEVNPLADDYLAALDAIRQLEENVRHYRALAEARAVPRGEPSPEPSEEAIDAVIDEAPIFEREDGTLRWRGDKARFVRDMLRAAYRVDRLPAGPTDALRDRDALWCKALIATLDTEEVENTVRWFNEHRPDGGALPQRETEGTDQ